MSAANITFILVHWYLNNNSPILQRYLTNTLPIIHWVWVDYLFWYVIAWKETIWDSLNRDSTIFGEEMTNKPLKVDWFYHQQMTGIPQTVHWCITNKWLFSFWHLTDNWSTCMHKISIDTELIDGPYIEGLSSNGLPIVDQLLTKCQLTVKWYSIFGWLLTESQPVYHLLNIWVKTTYVVNMIQHKDKKMPGCTNSWAQAWDHIIRSHTCAHMYCTHIKESIFPFFLYFLLVHACLFYSHKCYMYLYFTRRNWCETSKNNCKNLTQQVHACMSHMWTS